MAVRLAKLVLLSVLLLLAALALAVSASNLYDAFDGEADDNPSLPWAITFGVVAAFFGISVWHVLRWYRR